MGKRETRRMTHLVELIQLSRCMYSLNFGSTFVLCVNCFRLHLWRPLHGALYSRQAPSFIRSDPAPISSAKTYTLSLLLLALDLVQELSHSTFLLSSNELSNHLSILECHLEDTRLSVKISSCVFAYEE